MARIGPHLLTAVTGPRRHSGKVALGMLVGVFGTDALALCKRKSVAVDHDLLRPAADEILLDAAFPLGVLRFVTKAAYVELSAQLALDARQQIEIDRRRDALAVVIGLVDNTPIFF